MTSGPHRAAYLAVRAGRMAVRTAGFALLSALAVPVYILLRPFGAPVRTRIVKGYFRGCLALTGLHVEISSLPAPTAAARKTPTLFVANHVSYLDIPVLGAFFPGTFIAKGEVSRWPVFGFLARMSATLFVSRMNATLKGERDALAERLNAGENLFLFPEGTSSDGQSVSPFKSALFAPACEARRDICVQPLTIIYETDRAGRPLGGAARDRYAWYGDMEMLGHLLRVFASPGARVRILRHDTVSPRDFSDRKTLAKHCQETVARGLLGAQPGARPGGRFGGTAPGAPHDVAAE